MKVTPVPLPLMIAGLIGLALARPRARMDFMRLRPHLA
jgi:hypothetical protein